MPGGRRFLPAPPTVGKPPGRCGWLGFAATMAGGAGWALVGLGAEASGPARAVTAEADLSSRYIWRGLAFSPGAVIQPSVALAAGDVGLTLWFNCDLAPPDRTPAWNETDFTVSYSRSWGAWTLGATAQAYLYPSSLDQPDTAELVLEAGWESGEFELLLRQTVDVVAYPGAYYGELVPSWTRDLGAGFEFTATATLAWATEDFTAAYAGMAAGGFHLVGAEAALRWSLTPQWVLRPHAAVSHLLMDPLRRGRSEPDFVWGGLALTLQLP
jgi:hypothetical protein